MWIPDFSVLFESLQGVHVDLDAEDWFLWDGQFSIDEFQFVLNEFLPEFRVGQFCGEVFEEWTVRGDGREVGAGRDADSGFPAMWNNLSSPFGGHVANFHRLGEPADAADVRLGNIDFSNVQQVPKLVMRGQPFAGGDTDAAFVVQAGVAFEVIHP